MMTQKLEDKHQKKSTGFLYWDKQGHKIQKEVKDFLSIGRSSSNMLNLEDLSISRHHARIEKNKATGFFILKDMGSRNGCFLNGNRVYQAVLSNNDKITLGSKDFFFSFERSYNNWRINTQSQNAKWNEELSRIPHLAKNNNPILILGPSGTGKEVLAQAIHKFSLRNQNPLVSVNCSALTENLVESELFGHKKGSYTGSITDRKGAFVSANGGTLFLDEIGDLPLTLQPKFLRAIEYQEIKPVGSDQTLKTNVRIVSATHQDLKNKVELNEFRKDLYYRLNVITIRVPALTERMEDFESLVQNFGLQFGVTFSTKAMEVLKTYHWPGNIRELKNMVARAKALFLNEPIDAAKAHLILDQGEKNQTHQQNSNSLKDMEKSAIINYLKVFQGNQSKTANVLEIPRSTLNDRLRRYNINAADFKKSNFSNL